MSKQTEPQQEDEIEIAAHVLVIREGHGANCSSIGSIIDTLFVAQVAAGAILAAFAASLAVASTKEEAPAESEEQQPEEKP